MRRPTGESIWSTFLPPQTGPTVNLGATPGDLVAEWFSPNSGGVVAVDTIMGGTRVTLKAPGRGDAVLYIHR